MLDIVPELKLPEFVVQDDKLPLTAPFSTKEPEGQTATHCPEAGRFALITVPGALVNDPPMIIGPFMFTVPVVKNELATARLPPMVSELFTVNEPLLLMLPFTVVLPPKVRPEREPMVTFPFIVNGLLQLKPVASCILRPPKVTEEPAPELLNEQMKLNDKVPLTLKVP
jgi:hypothetical protein